MINIVFQESYKPSMTRWLAIHHTGGLGANQFASTQHLKARDIDAAHMQRFDMLSTLMRWGGYNFFIEKDGAITQFRAIGEETAAVKGYNFNGLCISVCLAGNFKKGVDTPTPDQIDSLKELYKKLPKVHRDNIVPHRALQSTECYGDLPDSWARDLLEPIEDKETTIKKILREIARLTKRLKRLQ